MQGPGLIALAAVLWGVDGVLRRSLFSLQPLQIVFYEHLLGFALLLPVWWPRVKQTKLNQRLVTALAGVSLLSGLLGTLWFTTALLKVQFIPFSVVFLLQKLQPVFAVLGARLVLGERLERDYFKWAGLAVVAAYFVTFPLGRVNLDTGAGTLAAAGYAVLAAAAWGFSTALSRYLLNYMPDSLVVGWRFGLTSLWAGLGLLLTRSWLWPGDLSASQWGSLLAISLSTGMVALWIYYRGLQMTEVKVSTITELIFPLTAVLIDYWVYGQWLHWSQYLAGAVMLLAISLLVRSRMKYEVLAD